MHVADAVRVSLEHRDGIAARERHVAAVEQQSDVVADAFHQPIDVRRRLHVGAHVVMIGEAHAALPRVARERGQALAVFAPLRGAREARPLVERHARSLDAVGDLAVHEHRGAAFGEQRQVRLDGGDLLGDGAPCEPPRIPAGHEREPVRGEHVAQRLRLARKLVAELEALVTDRGAFGERDRERRLAAERRQVVVAPRDRVDADAHVERPRLSHVVRRAPYGRCRSLSCS